MDVRPGGALQLLKRNLLFIDTRDVGHTPTADKIAAILDTFSRIVLYSRIGTALYKRRQDPQNTSSYMHIKKVMLRDGFITRWQFCVSVAGILFLKFAPCGLIRTVYKKILRKKQGDFS